MSLLLDWMFMSCFIGGTRQRLRFPVRSGSNKLWFDRSGRLVYTIISIYLLCTVFFYNLLFSNISFYYFASSLSVVIRSLLQHVDDVNAAQPTTVFHTVGTTYSLDVKFTIVTIRLGHFKTTFARNWCLTSCEKSYFSSPHLNMSYFLLYDNVIQIKTRHWNTIIRLCVINIFFLFITFNQLFFIAKFVSSCHCPTQYNSPSTLVLPSKSQRRHYFSSTDIRTIFRTSPIMIPWQWSIYQFPLTDSRLISDIET